MKKFVSMFLAVVMIASMFAAMQSPAYADDLVNKIKGSSDSSDSSGSSYGSSAEVTAAQPEPEYEIGDIITFGRYEQDNNTENGKENIEWQVLAVEEDKLLLISKYGLDSRRYEGYIPDATWQNSALCRWLNVAFWNTAFTAREKAIVEDTKVIPDDNSDDDTNYDYDTTDKVFLLSISEAEKYFTSDESRQCAPTDYAKAQGALTNDSYRTAEGKVCCCWWLRNGDGSSASYVYCGGAISSLGHWTYGTYDCVRPALWLNLKEYNEYRSSINSKEKTETAAEITSTDGVEIGSLITFGTYEQDNDTSNGKEDIEWKVLDKQDNKILVISEYGLDVQPYNEEWMEVTWETCTLRKWLNNKFINSAFTAEEQSKIQKTKVSADKNLDYETDQGKDTTDKVFLLSIGEANNYFGNGNVRQCYPTEYAFERGKLEDYFDDSGCWWWLRSPGRELQDCASFVDSGGAVYGGHDVSSLIICVRPAMWVSTDIIRGNGNQSAMQGTVKEPVPIDEAEIGSLITFGTYEQDNDTDDGKESIEWQVLDKKGNSLLIISKYGLADRSYNLDSEDVTWETCSVRRWLNEEFLSNAFTAEEQTKIQVTNVTAERNPNYDTDAGNGTLDRAFLLSVNEADRYFNGEKAGMCAPTAYAKSQGADIDSSKKTEDGEPICWWWLRSPGCDQYDAACFHNDSSGEIYVNFRNFCVRPAMWISQDENNIIGDMNDTKTTEIITETVQIGEAQKGSLIKFGTYEQDNNASNGKEDIEWQVLDKKGNKLLIISRYGLTSQSYNADEDIIWEDSPLRKWLNNKFISDAFSADEQIMINETKVTADKNPKYNTDSGNDTTDKVFLLSIKEAEKYFTSDSARECEATNYAVAKGASINGCCNCFWWLRSPGSAQFLSASIECSGEILYMGTGGDGGCVRPAMWISTDA